MELIILLIDLHNFIIADIEERITSILVRILVNLTDVAVFENPARINQEYRFLVYHLAV